MCFPFAVLIRLCFVLAAAAASLAAAEITLSPDGPIRTPAAARDAARKEPKPVRIVVADGNYAITEALALGPEDSQTRWEAQPGTKPVFNGGRAITGWTKQADGVWKADLPEVREGKWFFEQLWVNGRRATRARTPNRGFFNIADATERDVFPGVPETLFRAFSVHPEHYEILKAIPALERPGVLLTVAHAWAVGQCRIEALDDPSRSVLIKGKSHYPFVAYEPDQRYWLENFRAALDAPGEWFLDRAAGALFYLPRPGEDVGKAIIVAPVADQAVTIQGASDVQFCGLRFLYGNYAYPKDGLHDTQAATSVDGAVEIENARGIRFEDCEIAHAGRYGIYFRNGCADSVVVHCHLHDLGAGGVRIGQTDRPSEERICRRITVDDCILQHMGRLHPAGCGVVLTHAMNCTVSHCDIGDLYYSGVSAGWTWGYGESLTRENRIEDNHIHHLGWAYLSDMGGFYGLGTSPGTVVRGNHLHHIASHRYGGWGLYTDEGSTDVLMENNLVHDTSEAGFHQHYGYYNRVRNNILAFGQKAQVQRSRNEPRTSFFFERNIVVWDPRSPLLDGGAGNWRLHDKAADGEPRDTAIFRRNLYWPTDGKIPAKLAGTWTWAEWQNMGRDAGSLFTDPLFVDVAQRDFRLRLGSPAAKIGFQPWDLSAAGVRVEGPGGAAWRALAAQGHIYPRWEAEAKPWPAPIYSVALQTFEGVPPGSLGLRNAKYVHQDKGEWIGVTSSVGSPIPWPGAAAAESKRSLKVQDVPGLRQNYDPTLDVATNWEAGTVHASFDVMAEAGADWFFEMRSHPGGEFAAGPLVIWQNGQLGTGAGGSNKLLKIPAGEWFRVELTARLGSGRYDVVLTRQDGTRQDFKDQVCKASWTESRYLLWSSLGTTKTAFYLDNVRFSCEL